MDDLSVQTPPDGLFDPARRTILDLVAERNRRRLPTFINAALPLVEEAAQAALVLSTYLHHGDDGATHRTFFCNSTLEALHGAIKLVRDLTHGREGTDGRILVWDPTDRLEPHFDPLGQGPERALVPGIHFVAERDRLREELEREGWAGVIAGGPVDQDVESVVRLRERCREKDLPFVLDLTARSGDALDSLYGALEHPPDVVAWGEGLVDRQVPFGAFSASERAHSPWTKASGFLKHSSTYSGNGLALAMMIEHTLRGLGWGERFPGLDARVATIAEDPEARRAAFERFVNPLYLYYFDFVFLDGVIEKASGSTLTVRGNDGKVRELIDAIGANGTSLRGHNPPDMVPEVVEVHDPERDYGSELARELRARVGLEHAFPAVSGASAVETALTLALLGHGQKKIVTFQENFSGKTLVSMIATRSPKLQHGFGPLYPQVVTVDPKSSSARAELREHLRGGDVALVWLELVQGQAMYPIPAELLETIEAERETGGYWVGLDEVYLGMYRTGTIVQDHGALGRPDLVCLSKGLSDMTFPIAATLASAPLVEAARAARPELVERLETLYRNQLGAHVGLHALHKVDELGLPERVREAGRRLQERLAEATAPSPLIRRVAGKGLAITLEAADTAAALLLARLARERGGVLLNGARLTPALTLSDEDLDRLVAAVTHRPGLRLAITRRLDKLRTKVWYLRGKRRAG